MTFSIEKFKQNGPLYGGARPSLFKVYIPPFPNSTGSNVNLSEGISFMAKAASIPPSLVDYIDVPYMSRKIKVSGDRTFPDWVVTLMNDEDFKIRAALEDWHEAINSREPNRMYGTGLSATSMYKRDLIVYQYSKTGNAQEGTTNSPAGNDDATPIAVYNMIGAFPTSIDAIPLDWDAVNQMEQFDVTFAYDYWKPGTITS